MVNNKAAENAFGTLGTICWTIQLLPQLWKSYRTKSTEGLSEWLMLTWSLSSATFGVYAIVQGLSVPLILQQQSFMLLALISWTQCQYYGRKFSKLGALGLFSAAVVFFAGFEVAMVYAIRPSHYAGNKRPTQFFGIFTIVLTNSAMIPQYYEIWKYKKVIGISLIFLAVDLMGGVFNDLAIAFKTEIDIVACVSYSLVVFMDGVIILLSFILNPRAERREAKKAALAKADKEALESSDRDVEADVIDVGGPSLDGFKQSKALDTPDLEKEYGLVSVLEKGAMPSEKNGAVLPEQKSEGAISRDKDGVVPEKNEEAPAADRVPVSEGECAIQQVERTPVSGLENNAISAVGEEQVSRGASGRGRVRSPWFLSSS